MREIVSAEYHIIPSDTLQIVITPKNITNRYMIIFPSFNTYSIYAISPMIQFVIYYDYIPYVLYNYKWYNITQKLQLVIKLEILLKMNYEYAILIYGRI